MKPHDVQIEMADRDGGPIVVVGDWVDIIGPSISGSNYNLGETHCVTYIDRCGYHALGSIGIYSRSSLSLMRRGNHVIHDEVYLDSLMGDQFSPQMMKVIASIAKDYAEHVCK